MRNLPVLAAALWLLASLPAGAALELHDARVQELDNGLTVLLLEDRNFPVVSVQMLYRVGARNEVDGKTGLAHFLEHMAFRSTERFADTEVVSRIYAVGGEWHGYTWNDQTTYFATVPKEHWPLLLEIEAERMSRLVIDPATIEAEQGAVLAEMRLYDANPASLLIDAIASVSFLVHPYRHNTIGWESDVRSITARDLREFYERHYRPGNAVLAVVGDFDADEVMARIDTLFAGGERQPATPLPHSEEPPQTGERRIAIRGVAPGTQFAIAYRAPAVTHPDFAVFLVLQEILAGGSGVNFLQNDWGTPVRKGRLLDGAADGITSWFPPSAMEYLFVIGGQVGDGDSERDTEGRIEVAVAALRDRAPGDRIVADAAERVIDELVYDLQTTEDAAHLLAFFAGLDALDVLLTLPARIRSVTAADVQRVAASWLRRDRRSIAWYRQEKARPVTHPAEVFEPDVPVPGPIDETPVGKPVLRRLEAGLPAVIAESDLSPSVFLKVVVPGRVAGSRFAPDDPEPGFSSWHAFGRPDGLPDLVAGAAHALDSARRGPPAQASSSDPAARLGEEFAAVMADGLPTVTGPVIPSVVVLAGNVEQRAAFAALQKAFGTLQPAEVTTTAGPGIPAARREVSVDIALPQAQLGYIVAGPAPSAPDYAAWRILQYIFVHDYEGRFGKAAISERGLAYYVDARYRSAGGPGWTTFAIGVDKDRLPALEELMRAEFARLAAEPPTAAETSEAKRHLHGRAISAAQSNEEIATVLARQFLHYGSLLSADRSRRAFEAATLDAVRDAIPAFTSGLTFAVVPGPESR